MGALTPMHLILILAVALLVIGPGKLPETGAALGKAIRQFRDAANGITEDAATATTAAESPAPAATPAESPAGSSAAGDETPV